MKLCWISDFFLNSRFLRQCAINKGQNFFMEYFKSVIPAGYDHWLLQDIEKELDYAMITSAYDIYISDTDVTRSIIDLHRSLLDLKTTVKFWLLDISKYIIQLELCRLLQNSLQIYYVQLKIHSQVLYFKDYCLQHLHHFQQFQQPHVT